MGRNKAIGDAFNSLLTLDTWFAYAYLDIWVSGPGLDVLVSKNKCDNMNELDVHSKFLFHFINGSCSKQTKHYCSANTLWSNLSFTIFLKRLLRSEMGTRDPTRLMNCWSIGSPPFPMRDRTQAPLRVLRKTCGVWRLSSTAISPPEFPIPKNT